MLARRLSVLFAILGAALGGCVIEVNDNPDPSGVGGGGGQAATGTGGEGGETTTTTTTTTTAGVGGSGGTGGGEPTCVGADGKGTVSDCNLMNITPESQGGAAPPICGDNDDEEPPGYGVCVRGFEIFTAGSATNLQECLAKIGIQDACEIDPVGDCVGEMLDEACLTQTTIDICTDLKTACGGELDESLCRSDFAPLSDKGLAEFEDCFNNADPNLNCQDAYEECAILVYSF